MLVVLRSSRKRRSFCTWGHVCRSAGVLLYKHRALALLWPLLFMAGASMPFRARNALAAYTEVL